MLSARDFVLPSPNFVNPQFCFVNPQFKKKLIVCNYAHPRQCACGKSRGDVRFDLGRDLDLENVVFCGIRGAIDPRIERESTNPRLRTR
jgi:hypothetical protein